MGVKLGLGSFGRMGMPVPCLRRWRRAVASLIASEVGESQACCGFRGDGCDKLAPWVRSQNPGSFVRFLGSIVGFFGFVRRPLGFKTGQL